MTDQTGPIEPIDVGAVRHDDAFLDDLAAGRAAEVGDRAEYELAGLMAAWRSDVHAGAVPSTPTVDEIQVAIARVNERERRGGLTRRLRIVSGAAAVMAVAGAGLLVLSEGSQPGDALWAVKEVVFSDQAQQTQARMSAEDNIAAARRAYAAGDTVKARELIAKAEGDLGPLGDKSDVESLRKQIDDVRAKDPTKLIPSLPSLPQLPTLLEKPAPPSDTDTVDKPSPSEPSEPSEPSDSSSSTQKPTTSKTKPSSSTPSASSPTSGPTSAVR